MEGFKIYLKQTKYLKQQVLDSLTFKIRIKQFMQIISNYEILIYGLVSGNIILINLNK